MAELELRGSVCLADGEYPQAWVVDGCLQLNPPDEPAQQMLEGFFSTGLVDVHCHVGLGKTGVLTESQAREQIVADRNSGVLAIRDAGSPLDTRFLQNDHTLPLLVRAGRHLARPRRYLRGYAEELASSAELPAAMARQANASDGWVKIVADWIDRGRGKSAEIEPLWAPSDLQAGIAAAHRAGARVCAHAFSHQAITPLLEAGIDCIEHGTGMDTDQMYQAARQGVAVTPTLRQVNNFAAFAVQGKEKYPAYATQVQGMYNRRSQQFLDLWKAGIQLLPGSDAGGTIAHGQLRQELELWEKAGMPWEHVWHLATAAAREYLNLPSFAAGNRADFLHFSADPRRAAKNLGTLRSVILGGQIVFQVHSQED